MGRVKSVPKHPQTDDRVILGPMGRGCSVKNGDAILAVRGKDGSIFSPEEVFVRSYPVSSAMGADVGDTYIYKSEDIREISHNHVLVESRDKSTREKIVIFNKGDSMRTLGKTCWWMMPTEHKNWFKVHSDDGKIQRDLVLE